MLIPMSTPLRLRSARGTCPATADGPLVGLFGVCVCRETRRRQRGRGGGGYSNLSLTRITAFFLCRIRILSFGSSHEPFVTEPSVFEQDYLCNELQSSSSIGSLFQVSQRIRGVWASLAASLLLGHEVCPFSSPHSCPLRTTFR